jgi:hypothetical protein
MGTKAAIGGLGGARSGFKLACLLLRRAVRTLDSVVFPVQRCERIYRLLAVIL